MTAEGREREGGREERGKMTIKEIKRQRQRETALSKCNISAHHLFQNCQHKSPFSLMKKDTKTLAAFQKHINKRLQGSKHAASDRLTHLLFIEI